MNLLHLHIELWCLGLVYIVYLIYLGLRP